MITSCEKKQPEGRDAGCLLQHDLSFVSLSTGVTYNLLPPEIVGEHFLRISTVALTTSTVYYVDYTAGMMMSYHPGDAHPKKLYDLPTTGAIENIYWLLLSPSEETLLFLLIEQGQNGECSSTNTLIAYDVHTDRVRLIALSDVLEVLQCPAWIDTTTLLVLTADATIGTVDMLSGKFVPMLAQAGYFALSPTKTFLLVNTDTPPITHFPSPTEFVLYEFPSLNLLKNLSLTMFRYEGVERFSFTDDQHMLFALRSDPMLRSKTVWLDWHSLKYSKMSNDGFQTYLSACPSWGTEAPSGTDRKLVQNVKDRLDRSASQIPMRDFISLVPEGNGVINVFGTLRTQEDMATVRGLVEHVSGVKDVMWHVEIGNYQWMYEQKIEHYLKWGYTRYKNYDHERKQKIAQHLNEYLAYRDDLAPQRIQDVEELYGLLMRDIEQKK